MSPSTAYTYRPNDTVSGTRVYAWGYVGVRERDCGASSVCVCVCKEESARFSGEGRNGNARLDSSTDCWELGRNWASSSLLAPLGLQCLALSRVVMLRWMNATREEYSERSSECTPHMAHRENVTYMSLCFDGAHAVLQSTELFGLCLGLSELFKHYSKQSILNGYLLIILCWQVNRKLVKCIRFSIYFGVKKGLRYSRTYRVHLLPWVWNW